MAENSYQTITQRESPDIEAQKLALMAEAKRLYEQPMTMPAIEAAGLSLGEQQAMDLARQGIGSFEPYIQGGSQAITQGMDLAQRGALAAGAIQTDPAFQTAQDTLGYGINTLAPMAQYESLAGSGLQDIGSGIGRVARSGDLAGSYMQGDLRPATGSIQAAQAAATSATPSDFTTSARILGSGMQGAADATGLAGQAAERATQQYGQAAGSVGAAQLAAMYATPSDFSTSVDILGSGLQGAAGATQSAQDAARTGSGQYQQAQDLNRAFSQANLAPSTQAMGRASSAAQRGGPSDFSQTLNVLGSGMQGAAGATQAAQQASQQAAQQYGSATGVLGAGIGALQGAAQAYDPSSVEAYMNPYQREVTQQGLQEMRRQADIARQGMAAQAVGAGAFGGTREGVQRAEFDTRVQDQMQQRIMQDYAQNYAQAQQASQQGFESQQQRQLAQAQGFQQAAGQSGQLSGQQAQLALQAASQQFQQAGYDANTAMQMAQLQQTQQQQTIQQSAAFQGIGERLGQQSLQQAQLGQAAAGQSGQLAGQQAQLGLQAAAQQFQQAGYDANTAMQIAQLQQTQQGQSLQQSSALQGIGALQGQLAGQQAQVGMQAAAQRFQQAGYDANTAMQMAQLQQTQQGQALQQSSALQGIGSLQGQQAMQQAQLGQSGAQLVGQLGAQQAQLGLLPGQIAQTQAGIGAQRAGLYGQLGQGIGALTAQQAATDLNKAQVLGGLGAQMGGLGTQMGALGEATQQLGAADTSLLAGIGGLERQVNQSQLDAIRATKLQEETAQMQQLGFLSDIYRGAPTTQMSMTSQSAPSASPLQTVAGLGVAGLATAKGLL